MCKRILILILVALLSSVVFLPTEVRAVNVDRLIKSSESTLYYYAADGKRYVFPNEKTYKSWFLDFSNVVELANSELAAIPLAGNITYRPGVRMVKIQTDPKTYAVSRGGILRWVKTEEVATALYGNDWNTKIDDMPDTFFVNYTIGEPIEFAGDYDRNTEMTSTTTINDDKGIEKSASPLGSNTGDMIAEEPEPDPEPEPEIQTPTVVYGAWNNFNLTNLSDRQQSPDILVADSKFIFVWTDYSGLEDEVKSGFIGTDGELESGPFIVTDNLYESTAPSLAKSNLDIAVAWEDYVPGRREIYFARVDEYGNRVSIETRITNKIGQAKNPKIALDGSDYYGIVWWDSRAFGGGIGELKGKLYFQLVERSGQLTGYNKEISSEFSTEFAPDLIWGNNEFVVVWADSRNGQKDIYLVRFDIYGNILGGGEVRLTETENDSLNPRIVWDGSSYGVVWQEKADNVGVAGTHYEIYYQKVGANGEKSGGAKRITVKNNGDSEEPSVVLNDDKIGVVWADYRDSLDKTQSDIYFTEINIDGIAVSNEEKVSDTSGLSLEPEISVLNGAYAIVFTDDSAGNKEIYSAVRIK